MLLNVKFKFEVYLGRFDEFASSTVKQQDKLIPEVKQTAVNDSL